MRNKKTSARSFGFYEDARILTDFFLCFLLFSPVGLFQRVWLVCIVLYCIVVYIEKLGVDERKSLGGKLGAGSEEKSY